MTIAGIRRRLVIRVLMLAVLSVGLVTVTAVEPARADCSFWCGDCVEIGMWCFDDCIHQCPGCWQQCHQEQHECEDYCFENCCY